VRRHGLRARVAAVTALALAGALGGAAVAFVIVFGAARTHAHDAATRRRAALVADLVASGQLPDPLPVPPADGTLVQVLDDSGRVLAASQTASRTLPLVGLEALRAKGSGHALPVTYAVAGAPLRASSVAATWQGRTVYVVAATSTKDVHDALATLRLSLALVVPVAVLLGTLASWSLVGATLRPVEALRAAADGVTDLADPAPLPVPVSAGDGAGDGDEIARLAATLNRMLARLADADAGQRAFLADAAHELRSPAASIRTQLEVAVAHPDAQPWDRTAATALAEAVRLSGLLDELLLLARLDADVRPRTVAVDVVAVVTEVAAEPRRVPVSVVAAGPVHAAAEADGLRRAVRNLVDNAARHATAAVAVTVTSVAGADVEVAVADDGPGVPADAAERVFDRFTRLDDSRARADGGAGLGLPIARALARAYGGDVRLDQTVAPGARFVLRLRASE
jgi:signal transduction histidine kinase